MIAELDPTATAEPKGIVIAAGEAQLQIDKLKLALMMVNNNLLAMRMVAEINTATAPMLPLIQNADAVIREALEG